MSTMSTRQEARRDEGDSRKDQEASLRDRAHLSQQRRLKQATQFLHKDSADLLPLDSLKRLGTSKDLQPHSVIQRRLVEGNQRRLQGESPLLQALIHGHDSSRTSATQVPALLVNCKVRSLPVLTLTLTCLLSLPTSQAFHSAGLSRDGEVFLSFSGPACTFLSPLCTARCPHHCSIMSPCFYQTIFKCIFSVLHTLKRDTCTKGSCPKVKKNLRLCMFVISRVCTCVHVVARRSCFILWNCVLSNPGIELRYS
ncbi:nuclear receptor-interacting protein 2 isoform X1 [Mastomys coucha]|uniref:nuclear receptor-interacting protein 2 isoform X1 n=1 Tax=Mastomys coucha TaxID=35658 RepID=UPI0012619029|nr:nuclear receptor-interacting protein 2 isoform X1 [Mastomys coucha]